jgi:hypothetical protein
MAWHRVITYNFGWKVVSVLLAMLVWALVRYSTSAPLGLGEVKTFDAVPIQVMTLANDPTTFKIEPPSVRLALTGIPSAIKRLRLNDLLVFVNLNSIPEVEAYREVEVHVPSGVALAALVPNQVRVIRQSATSSTNSTNQP